MNLERFLGSKREKYILIILVVLILALAFHNWMIAILGGVALLGVFWLTSESKKEQEEQIAEYLDTMTRTVDQASTYALQNLPTGIVILDSMSRICWSNSVFRDWMGEESEKTQRFQSLLPAFRLDKIWGKSGFFLEHIQGRCFRIIYKYLETEQAEPNDREEPANFMIFYMEDMTETEKIKIAAEASQPVFCYIQIDNIEEVGKGLNDAEQANLWAEVNNVLVSEITEKDGFIRSYTDESYIACISRKALDEMIPTNFPVPDKVHKIHSVKRIPVTISIGIATEEESLRLQGERARSALDLALGRGGDQAAVYIGSEVHFYGGKMQGTEKNTRVRARVVAQALKELINDSSNVVIMGHEREDYDSIGSAIGVAVMARAVGKPVSIAISEESAAITKLRSLFPDHPELEELLVTPQEAEELVVDNTLLFVVDGHRPDMVAAPKALAKASRRVVIDHHRRSSDFIEKPLLTYLEPSSSSTCELVTELIQYYGEDIELDKIEASALYAGIVVDTKNFAVQTGSRTFDAASYLRRSGADLILVRHLFMENFESSKLQGQLMVNAERYGNLVLTHAPKSAKNAAITAARVADWLITIEGVEAGFAFYYLPDGDIGISARSQGNLNVQVIMEEMGGGGHRTVAGAQIENSDMVQVQAQVLQIAQRYAAQLAEEEK